MHDDKDKKIGSAMYLNKSNGEYIPFKVSMSYAYFNLIQPMLDNTYPLIYYIDKKNLP